MLVLGIDTSSVVASVALVSDGKLLGEVMINHPKTHSQKLMPIVDQLLTNLEMKIKDLAMKRSKGIATRFLALLILGLIVFIIIMVMFYMYAPDLFEKLFDLVTKPFES